MGNKDRKGSRESEQREFCGLSKSVGGYGGEQATYHGWIVWYSPFEAGEMSRHDERKVSFE